MNKNLDDIFKEVPPFLEIFGFKGASIAEDKNSFTCIFNPSTDLTHSNGTIVQGGFVSGMLDSAMAQFIIFLSEGKRLPLTLDMTTTFLLPCEPNKEIEASISLLGSHGSKNVVVISRVKGSLLPSERKIINCAIAESNIPETKPP